MKSSRLIFCTLTGVLLIRAPLMAQDTLMYHLGVGISVEPALFGQTPVFTSGYGGTYSMTTPLFSVSPYYIYVPIALTKNFRIEPRFGVYTFSEETSNSLTPTQHRGGRSI